MTYMDWLESELIGYHEAGVVNSIDKETIENDPQCNTCQECGGSLRYEG